MATARDSLHLYIVLLLHSLVSQCGSPYATAVGMGSAINIK